MTRYWFADEIVQRFAGSLLHFLWQGAVVALIAAISLRLLSKRTAETRYAVSIAALIAMLAAPAITFVFYAQTGALTLKLLLWTGAIINSHGTRPAASNTAVWTRWIVMVWALGAFVFAARLVMSWHLSRTLIATSESVPAFVVQIFEQIKQRIVQSKTVRLLANARIDTPIVVGCLRPVVLLPVSAITGLNEDQLLAVLAHELAHIRRHDFFLNILQRGVESLLFYHPAVWWLSGRIRDERENCCDDVAVQMCGDRRIYVKALLDLESKRSAGAGLTVAAAGGSLVQRSRRILGMEVSRCDWQTAAVSLLFMAVWMAAGIWQSTVLAAGPRVSSIPTPQILAAVPMMSGLGAKSAPLPLTKAIGAIAAIVTAQPVIAEPPPGTQGAPVVQKLDTGSIYGIVARPGTTDGIADVVVTILDDGRTKAGPFNLKTDATGNFSINDVPAGPWIVRAEREGYLPTGEGPREQTVVTVTSQARASAVLHLIAAGTILGQITDSNGTPVAGVTVEAVLPGYDISGQRVWLQKTPGPRGAITNDHGEYRVYSFRPGDYYLRVLQRYQPSIVTPGVVAYFPGHADPALATPVTVREGVESTVDIALPHPSARKVSGSIHVDRTGTDALNVTLFAIPRDRRIPAEAARVLTRINGSDGSFSIDGLQPGSYDIRAEAGSPAVFTGRLTLDVSERDISGISLSLHPVVNLKAHVSYAGGLSANANAIPLMLISGDAIPWPQALLRPNVSGNLSLPNLAEGPYVFRAPLGNAGITAGLYVSDIRQGPRNVIETGLSIGPDPPEPLEITVSTGTGTIQGSTEPASGASSATVVLVPDPARRQNALLYKTIRADSTGRFTFNGVTPGRYALFAWESSVLSSTQIGNAAMNPEFLSQYETLGVGITVNAGATVASPKLSLIRSMTFPPIPPSNIPVRTAAPPVEPAGAVLEGKVTRSGTTEPVAGATVTASGANSVSAISDANGRFRIAGVPAGTYRIRAERDGYLPSTATPTVSQSVSKDQHVDGISVNLQMGGAISGRLLGLDGKPLAATPVIAGSTIPSDTARYPKSGYTNDRGEYRIFGLEPGTYIVGVNAQGTNSALNPRNTWVRTYFPNTMDLFRAVPVDVAEGANVTNIDFTIQQTPTVRISGKVINPLAPASSSSTSSPASVQLIPQEPSPLDTGSLPNQQYSVLQDGTFAIANVAPGTYYVVAVGSGSGSNIERPKAWTTVRVGQQDITDVNLTIQNGMKVTGRIVGGDRRLSIFSTLRLVASGAPLNVQGQMLLSQAAVIDDTGAFTVSNVPAGNYRFAMPNSLNLNMYISDVRIGTSSVLRNGITVDANAPSEGVVVSLGGTGTVVGTVLNSQGIGASAVTVVLQPDPQRSGDATLYKTATSSSSGRFTIADVPPGNYTVLAFQGFSVDPARSAQLLEAFVTSGQLVTVSPDSGSNVTVTLIPRVIP